MGIISKKKNFVANFSSNYFSFLYRKLGKRILDIVFSVVGIFIFFPLMIVISIVIKIFDGGNVLFFHTRVGYRGKKFKLVKFRTMVPCAEEMLKELLKNREFKEEWGKTFKLKDDPRVTKVGKFLRKTSLDEIPQFFNVLKGDMSIVGPRPITEEELEKFYRDKAEVYKSVRPGVTGYWQVMKRSNIENYKERVKMDEWYIENISFFLDLKIILRTIVVVFARKGAY